MRLSCKSADLHRHPNLPPVVKFPERNWSFNRVSGFSVASAPDEFSGCANQGIN